MKTLARLTAILAGLVVLSGCVSTGVVTTTVYDPFPVYYTTYPVYVYPYPIYRPYYHHEPRPCPPQHIVRPTPRHDVVRPSPPVPRHDFRPPVNRP